MIMDTPKYRVRRVFMDKRKPHIVAEDLTEAAAQEMVQADMKTNPDGEIEMLVYNKIKDNKS